jgi:hypothetical protein
MSKTNYVPPQVTSYGPLASFTGFTFDSTNTDTFEGLNQPDQTGQGSKDTKEVIQD